MNLMQRFFKIPLTNKLIKSIVKLKGIFQKLAHIFFINLLFTSKLNKRPLN